jgi:hypothetical protein
LLERIHIIIIGSGKLCTQLSKGFGTGRFCITCDCTNTPSFFQHASGHRAAHAAGGTTDCDEFCHFVAFKSVKSMQCVLCSSLGMFYIEAWFMVVYVIGMDSGHGQIPLCHRRRSLHSPRAKKGQRIPSDYKVEHSRGGLGSTESLCVALRP